MAGPNTYWKYIPNEEDCDDLCNETGKIDLDNSSEEAVCVSEEARLDNFNLECCEQDYEDSDSDTVQIHNTDFKDYANAEKLDNHVSDDSTDTDSMSISSLETMGTTSILTHLMEQTSFYRFDNLSGEEEDFVSNKYYDKDGKLITAVCECDHAKSLWCGQNASFMTSLTKLYK